MLLCQVELEPFTLLRVEKWVYPHDNLYKSTLKFSTTFYLIKSQNYIVWEY